jgi:hypothetical protein
MVLSRRRGLGDIEDDLESDDLLTPSFVTPQGSSLDLFPVSGGITGGSGSSSSSGTSSTTSSGGFFSDLLSSPVLTSLFGGSVAKKTTTGHASSTPGSSFPWGPVLGVGAAIAVGALLLHGRSSS